MESFTEEQRQAIKKAETLRGKRKAIILHGNGPPPPQGDVRSPDMWYVWLSVELEKLGIPTLVTNFPDPLYARETIWKNFVISNLGADSNTILIGHSSGAICTMRILEDYKILGAVLVSAYTTDCGNPVERASGYFNRPWQWDKIKSNATFIGQFHGVDDPFVPYEEALIVKDALQTEFQGLEDAGHITDPTVPQVRDYIKNKIQAASVTSSVASFSLKPKAEQQRKPLKTLPAKKFRDLANSDWVLFAKERPQSKTRLFCFHYNAGSAAMYKEWADIFTFIEIVPIQLPGHGTRVQEEAHTKLSSLVEDLAYALFPCDKNFAFFGYSMGGVIALELARYIQKHLGIEPKGILIGSEPGPQHIDVHTDPNSPDFPSFVEKSFSFPKSVTENPEQYKRILTMISNDLKLERDYGKNYVNHKFSCPVIAFWGENDPIVTKEEMQNWEITSGKFSLITVPKGSHLFVDELQEFPRILAPQLGKLL